LKGVPAKTKSGVTLENMAELFKAGAAAVGVGTALISKDALARRGYAAIGALAKQFLAAARQARAGWRDDGPATPAPPVQVRYRAPLGGASDVSTSAVGSR
jgi:hypothetical protein